MFSLTTITELFIGAYFSNINHYMGNFLTFFMASLIDSVKAGCWLLPSAPAMITGTLPSFVFLIATIPFVRELSYKCIAPCWRALKAFYGLPVDSDKKPCQVDQPLVSSLHCL